MTIEQLKEAFDSGQVPVLDIRLTRAFAEAHIAGAESLPFRQDGWAVLAQNIVRSSTVVIFTDNPRIGEAATKAWEALGGTVSGLWSEGIQPWKDNGEPTVEVKHLTVDDLAQRLGAVTVIDVREPYEWRSGVISGAKTIPLQSLPASLAELPNDQPHVMVCAHGNRSLIAAAFLADRGYTSFSVLGGMALWLGAGHPVDRI